MGRFWIAEEGGGRGVAGAGDERLKADGVQRDADLVRLAVE